MFDNELKHGKLILYKLIQNISQFGLQAKYTSSKQSSTYETWTHIGAIIRKMKLCYVCSSQGLGRAHDIKVTDERYIEVSKLQALLHFTFPLETGCIATDAQINHSTTFRQM